MSRDALEKGLGLLLSPDRADGEACARDLYRYASGDATPEEAAAFESHLAECRQCREDLEALGSMDESAEAVRRLRVWRPAIPQCGLNL